MDEVDFGKRFVNRIFYIQYLFIKKSRRSMALDRLNSSEYDPKSGHHGQQHEVIVCVQEAELPEGSLPRR
jgi:hypothetical protein